MDWLLSSEDPSVRFWALQDIEGKDRAHPDVVSAQDAVMESTPVRAILSAQQRARKSDLGRSEKTKFNISITQIIH